MWKRTQYQYCNVDVHSVWQNDRWNCWQIVQIQILNILRQKVPKVNKYVSYPEWRIRYIPTCRSPGRLHSQRWLTRRSVVTSQFVTLGSRVSNALPTFFTSWPWGLIPGPKFTKIGDDLLPNQVYHSAKFHRPASVSECVGFNVPLDT